MGAGQVPSAEVPLVGCKSFGQDETLDAPTGSTVRVPIGEADARLLAYYKSGTGIGVLGPRAWHCEGVSGSGGYSLFLSPEPIDRSVPGWDGVAGPAIDINHITSENSGRYEIAEMMARVFPSYRAFALSVMTRMGLTVPSGPYPGDSLTSVGKNVVEYKTRAGDEGLGTYSWVKKGNGAITGTAILLGEPPDADLLLLAVRLPSNLARLTSVIVQEVERLSK
jgi:hypothetical protein